jgi:S-adenosylmethionine:tRNA ribosyltransferase-isomerase
VYSVSDYNYVLPSALIAQQPAAQRDRSRLLVLNRKNGLITHHVFQDLAEHLRTDDLIVVNNAAVIPARLIGRKDTGGKIELLILEIGTTSKTTNQNAGIDCECLIKASKPPRAGSRLWFDRHLQAEVLSAKNGRHVVRFYACDDFEKELVRLGQMPLPPYIKRDGSETAACDDRARYQTVYATEKGAVAAPTAGLHFTEDLLEELRSKGIGRVAITLLVGYGTFAPVREADIRRHRMHSEQYHISQKAADAINTARSEGRRIVAVGTTCVRTLEHASNAGGKLAAGSGSCNLFIYPGYPFKIVDALITNFHLPKSTLLMLVAAFAGPEPILKAYKKAVEQRYRFFSYGDAMLIL